MKVQFTLSHAAFTASGTGRESFQIKPSVPAVQGMIRLVLRVEGVKFEVTMDAVTAHNLGVELVESVDGYLAGRDDPSL